MTGPSWVNWFSSAALLIWWPEDGTKQAIRKVQEIVPSWRGAAEAKNKLIANQQEEFCLYSKFLMQKGLAGNLPIDEYFYLLKQKENELNERIAKFDAKILVYSCE